jgi:hypothetical protein
MTVDKNRPKQNQTNVLATPIELILVDCLDIILGSKLKANNIDFVAAEQRSQSASNCYFYVRSLLMLFLKLFFACHCHC